MGKLTPSRMVILSFLSAICLGTIALSLPIATHKPGGLSFIDSLFTATSATCVTGLVVQNTGTYFTTFGRWVIFVLFQSGGLGIMTFSTLFAVVLGRRIGLNQSETVSSTLYDQNRIGLKRLMCYILGITFSVEAIGATLLYFRWRVLTDWTFWQTVEASIFHSVSGFCNAGFALFSTSFIQFRGDAIINSTMIALIVIGGIGFVVIMDVIGLFFKKGPERKISLQAKVALTASLVLIVAGALVLFFVEKDGVLKGMPMIERVWTSVFQSVTARTTGFNTLPIGELAVPSLVFLMFLMFIGASPGSTGGGIKTCTIVVICATIWNMLKNRRRVMIFGRSIPKRVIRESLIIFFLSVAWIFVMVLAVTYLRTQNVGGDISLVRLMFEIFSAFGTVGLSTGITENLDNASKLCIIATMFAGRIGPLTLALAIAFRERGERYIFPEENIMVG